MTMNVVENLKLAKKYNSNLTNYIMIIRIKSIDAEFYDVEYLSIWCICSLELSSTGFFGTKDSPEMVKNG